VPFREFRQDGALLIGFEVGTKDLEGWNTEVLAYIRPIYRTGSGEQFGTAYGRTRGPKQTVKAKEGYALGGVTIAGGGHLEGLCLTFMRVGEGGLDPEDAYVSEWFGEQRRKPVIKTQMKNGDGSLVVGIHGELFEDKGGYKLEENGGVCNLGLIVIPSKMPPSNKAPAPPDSIPPNKTEGPARTPPPPTTSPVTLVAPARAIANRQHRTRLLGGAGDFFNDEAPKGGWLVGIEAHVTKFASFDGMGAVRPIFQTGDKLSDGELHGKETDRVVRAVARPGYAVGAINVKAAAGVNGFSVTFMKVTENGTLDTNDSYESEWIGGTDGGPKTTLGGTGAPVIALLGMIKGHQYTCAIGLITTGTPK
jgi:hypothetical protein